MSKPTIPEVFPLIKEYCEKPENGAGGSLHIYLEDQNCKDSDIQFCIEWAKEKGDEDAIRIGRLLLQMSKTQRRKLAVMTW